MDPLDIKNMENTREEYEEFLLFCIAVAGKKASVISKCLKNLLNEYTYGTPFEKINRAIKDGVLNKLLIKHSLGQYKKLYRAYTQLINSNIDVMNCTIDELENIYGIGMKTSRFFILHTNQSCNDVAVLDVHILKFLRKRGYDVPYHTPSRKKYKEIEKIFLEEVKDFNMNLIDIDFGIWKGEIT